MDNTLVLILLSVVLVCFLVFVIIMYFTSGFGSASTAGVSAVSAKTPLAPAPPPKICNKDDTKELQRLLHIAVTAIKSNIQTVKREDIWSYRPQLLLTYYPYLVDILRLPKYLAENPCYDNTDINKVIHNLYGNDLRKAKYLHADIPGYPNYYLLIELQNALDYYKRYQQTDLANLL